MDGEPKTNNLPQFRPFSGFASLVVSLGCYLGGRAPRRRDC
jgi:hypothetical protein